MTDFTKSELKTVEISLMGLHKHHYDRIVKLKEELGLEDNSIKRTALRIIESELKLIKSSMQKIRGEK